MTTKHNFCRVMEPAEYHAMPGISSSMLKACDPPARLKYQLDNPVKPTEAMTFGTTVHELVFGRPVSALIRPAGMDFRTTAGKTWKKAAEMSGAEIITQAEVDDAARCRDAVMANSHAREILMAKGRTDLACFYYDERNRYQERCLLDWRPDVSDFICDLKTVRGGGAEKRKFTREAIDRGYHLQAAWYRYVHYYATGDWRPKFLFIVVETEAPFLTAVYDMPEDFIKAGEDECLRRAEMIRDCQESGIWPGLPEYQTLEKPAWLGQKTDFDFFA